MFLTKSKNNDSLPLARLLPNLVTIAGLCIGLSSIRFAIEGEILKAVSFLLLAGFLDGIDGRLARFLNSSSDFGAQLDSLIDFVNFGVVPGFILYMWVNSFADIRGFDWALVLLFAICISLRLARFNIAINQEPEHKTLEKYFFQGIPAPCAAAMAILPLVLFFQFGDGYFFTNPVIVLCYGFSLAILAVSTIPTISIKKIPVKNKYICFTLLILGSIIIGLVVQPWLTLAIIGTVYLFSIPITTFFYFKIKFSSQKNL